MFGVHYLQQISDANVPGKPGLHIEPGIWLAVPATTDPEEPPTVVRMASIPHGTTIVAQGTASFGIGPPVIPGMSIIAVQHAHPRPERVQGAIPRKYHQPSAPSPRRSTTSRRTMIDNPSSVLEAAIANQKIETFTRELKVSTKAARPGPGGQHEQYRLPRGASRDGHGPNANAVQVDATFWIELVDGNGRPAGLSISCNMRRPCMLVFDDYTWPHATVATLRQTKQTAVPIQRIDPDIPVELLGRIEERGKALIQPRGPRRRSGSR